MFKEEREVSKFKWSDLGNIELGRSKFTEFAILSGFELATPVRDCGKKAIGKLELAIRAEEDS